jgi:hypothetical protein
MHLLKRNDNFKKSKKICCSLATGMQLPPGMRLEIKCFSLIYITLLHYLYIKSDRFVIRNSQLGMGATSLSFFKGWLQKISKTKRQHIFGGGQWSGFADLKLKFASH